MVWQSLLDIDKQLLLALNGDGGAGWDTFFYIVSARLTWVPLYAAILYAVWKQWGWRRLLWVAVVLGLCVGAADQICNFFKHFTPKFRPTHTPDIEAFVHTVRGYRGGLYGDQLRDRAVHRPAVPKKVVYGRYLRMGAAARLQPHLPRRPLPDGHSAGDGSRPRSRSRRVRAVRPANETGRNAPGTNRKHFFR